MTSAPVPLAEQIAAARWFEENGLPLTEARVMRAVLATLQKHERAMAALWKIAYLEIPEHKREDLEFCRATAVIARG